MASCERGVGGVGEEFKSAHMDRKRKAAADEGTLKAQRPLPRQHRDRERRALESAEAGTTQQSPLPSLEQPWVQESPAAIEEVCAMPDIGPPGRNTS